MPVLHIGVEVGLYDSGDNRLNIIPLETCGVYVVCVCMYACMYV